MFLSNIIYPALFGKTSLKNEKVILAELTKLLNNIEHKISDLNGYLADFTNN